MSPREFFVYLMASKSQVLYVGYTNHLWQRVLEHKMKLKQCFTQKYNVTRLVYYEIFIDPLVAIAREKQIKRWRREKKLKLITLFNPQWNDLSEMNDNEVNTVKCELKKIPPARSG